MSIFKRLQADEENQGSSHAGAGSMRWLLTYADLITLLMAFFIVMYAVSKVDMARYQQLAQALSQIFTSSAGSMVLPELGSGNQVTPPDELAGFSQDLQSYLAEQGLKDQVFVTATDQGLIISFTGSVLFDRGQATLRPASVPILQKIAGYLGQVPNYIGVAGSTDDLPINTSQFPTNWELSVIRATTVIRYFTETAGLAPSRFVALGYGQYHPLFPNNSEEDRRKNRRVDIIIYKQNPFAHQAR
ncbi:MAG: chemotaxis protein MotB [Moorella sp. (in: firmicutes)]|uniref:Motility protein B n=1 Tax=Neomoorella thermoacetica TaxID=1525 RepID=A0A1J5P769_NEOTH|nr:chemotaxis protein MotB [Moorella sp. (in: firmicutes)]OIQ61211.1 motility protein B [Moorella thermoacetica]